MKHKLILISALLLAVFSSPLQSQISQGGRPASFGLAAVMDCPVIALPAPDQAALREEDITREKMAEPMRIGVAVKAGANIQKDGIWETTGDGTRTWRLSLESPGALGISLCFDDFHLGDFTRLYIYDRSREVILGAYTSFNNRNNRLFATELLPGDLVTLEINMDAQEVEFPALSISEISYVYRNFYDYSFERIGSGSCEVNINCPEGDNWQKQKRGVTRIYVKETGGFYWCSGSLVNNTAQDLEPFLLTADHCASDASAEDLAQWIFYFNFEATGCENPAGTPPSNTMTGGVKLASATTNGSDFFLIRLNEEVPASYQPYFNGWNAENIPSISGASIHHPAGDIKKISTYNQQITNSQWGSIPNTHWQVIWAETLNGWGVTEGGSSGAPLFDNNGRIIGTLTGGLASCDNTSGSGPDQPDYFGKFSFSWDQNGEAPEQQLKYWLDPLNTNLTDIPGTNASLTANFAATPTILLAGSTVSFTNLSSGLPNTWEWTFEGGTPDAYIGPDPPEILYSEGGSFDVGLVVSDGSDTDSVYLKDYIQVVGEVYPNPALSDVNIYINTELPANVTAEIFNILGQTVFKEQYPDQAVKLINIDVSDFASGVYMVRLTVKQRYIFGKFMKY